MKINNLLIAFCLTSSTIYAQTWEHIYGGILTEEASTVTQVNDSGFIVAGKTNSFGAGMNDFYFVRIDNAGNVVWTKTFGGIYNDYCSNILQTADSGFIACGNSNSFSNSQDAYIVKTDRNGTLMWSKVIGDSLSQSAESIVQTHDGGYCMAGADYDASNNSRLLLIRTDANGDTLWTKKFGRGSYNIGSALLQTPDSGFIIAGSSYNVAGSYYDVFVVRTDAAGDTLWTRFIDASRNTFGHSLAYNGSNYVIGGTMQENFLAISVDLNGSVVWQKEYDKGGLDRCYSISASGNNFLLGGYTGIFSNSDMLVIKIDNQGNELWSRNFGQSQTDQGWAIQAIPTGGFIMAGGTASTSDDMYVVRSYCDYYPPVNISAGDTVCLGADTIAIMLSSNNLSGVTYQWMKDDSIILGANQNTFAASELGTYNLIATDSGGCSNLSNEIFVYLPAPQFSVNPSPACVGDIIKLGDYNMAYERYTFYNWDFGDGATDTGFYSTHVYADTGWYSISRNVQLSNGNCNTYRDSIHITTTAIPPVDFDMLINSTNPLYNEACPGDIIEYIPYAYSYLFVKPPAFDAVSYLWDFGDGTTDTSEFPVHKYSITGQYFVTLTVTNHCGNQASVTDSIIIANNYFPVGSFSWTDIQDITNDTVQACENVLFHSDGGMFYEWDFNDGTTDTTSADSILHAFPTAGTYSVELIVKNGCAQTDTVIRNVIVAGVCTNINDQHQGLNNILVIPNPFDEHARIQIQGIQPEKEIEMFIYDVQGKILNRKNISGPEIKIERGNLNPGIYFFTIKSKEGQSWFGKFVVN